MEGYNFKVKHPCRGLMVMGGFNSVKCDKCDNGYKIYRREQYVNETSAGESDLKCRKCGKRPYKVNKKGQHICKECCFIESIPLSEKINLYENYISMFNNFYDHRFKAPTLFVTALIGSGGLSLYLQNSFKHEYIVFIGLFAQILMLTAIFYDLYLHQRVMISGAMLKRIELSILKGNETYGLMNDILNNRQKSPRYLRSIGRFFGIYVVLFIIVSVMLFLDAVETKVIAPYVHVSAANIFFYSFAFSLVFLFICGIRLSKIERYTRVSADSMRNEQNTEKGIKKYLSRDNEVTCFFVFAMFIFILIISQRNGWFNPVISTQNALQTFVRLITNA